MKQQMRDDKKNSGEKRVLASKPTTGKTFKGSKEKRTIFKSKIDKAMAASMAFGILAGTIMGATGITLASPIISGMAMDFNRNRDAQFAIERAAEYDAYFDAVKSRLNSAEARVDKIADYDRFIIQEKQEFKENKERKIEDLSKLNDAIKTYDQLRYVKDRTVNEESKYVEACKTIADLRYLASEVYHDAMKEKIAAAKGITDPTEIQNIEIDAYETFDDKAGIFGEVVKVKVNGSKEEITKKLKKQIIKESKIASAAGYDPDKTAFKDIPVDEVIDEYQAAMEFDKKYYIVVNNKGKLDLIERIQEKTSQEQDVGR